MLLVILCLCLHSLDNGMMMRKVRGSLQDV